MKVLMKATSPFKYRKKRVEAGETFYAKARDARTLEGIGSAKKVNEAKAATTYETRALVAAPKPAPASPTYEAKADDQGDLSSLTVAALKEIAAKFEIPIPASYRKAEIISAIEWHGRYAK
jgi:hypothetical protein